MGEILNRFVENQFVINLLVCATLSYLLGVIYNHCGYSLSNRRFLAWNFMVLSLATMMVITAVRSSVALSLGMVGALSIIRFRGAVKELEEMAYLFFAVSIGLGTGAGSSESSIHTVVAYVVVSAFIITRSFFAKQSENQGSMMLSISSAHDSSVQLDSVINTIRLLSSSFSIRRVEYDGDSFSAMVAVSFSGAGKLKECMSVLEENDENARITVLSSDSSLLICS